MHEEAPPQQPIGNQHLFNHMKIHLFKHCHMPTSNSLTSLSSLSHGQFTHTFILSLKANFLAAGPNFSAMPTILTLNHFVAVPFAS